MTQANFNYLQGQYGSKLVWNGNEKKIGEVCVDCSGLISWATGVVLGSAQLFDRAIKKELISTIKTAPVGALVWMRGHVGTYQWDSCFGTVVIYNSASQKEDVIQFLEKIFKY